MSLANNLKELRRNINWTQKEVSEHLDINIKRYQSWEEGRADPQICMLVKISKFYNITIDRLVTTDDKNERGLRAIIPANTGL